MSKFKEKVYKACRKVKKGQVSTYKEIGRAINFPKAFRAVGNALNKNPYAPKVPCHRIVRSNGEVGGFANGKKAKERLLKQEGIKIKSGRIVNFKDFFKKLAM